MAPSSPASSALLGRGIRLAQEWRLPLLYGAFTVVAFLVFLIETLPHEEIARSAVAQATAGAPVQIDFRNASFAFPSGYRFEDVRIVPRRAPVGPIRLSDLTISTPLAGLLFGNAQSARFDGALYGGELSGKAERDGATQHIELDLADLDLAKAGVDLLPAPGRLGGHGSIELDLTGDGRTLQSTKGDVRLSLRDLAVAGLTVNGIAVPDLTLASGEGTASIRGSRLTIENLRTSGDISIDATGNVLLRDPVAQSMLDLRVKIEAPAQARPAIRVLMALLPHRAPGEEPLYTLRGTVAAPQLR